MNILRVIILSDGSPDLEGMVQVLCNGHSPEVQLVRSLDELAAALPGGGFHLALGVDALPGPNGVTAPVYPVLAAAEPMVPFIAVAPAGEHDLGLAAIRSGAADYLTRDEPGRLPAAATRVLRDADRLRDCHQTERSEGLFRSYFRHLFAHSPEAIVLVDRDKRIIEANEGFGRLFGYTAQELAGRTLAETIVPEDMLEEHRHLYAQADNACFARAETVRRRKDGTLVRVGVLGCPIATLEGNAAYYAVYTDLSVRQKALEALRRAESNYRDFFLNAVEGLYVTTPVGRFVTVNPALADLLGFDSPGDLADNVRSISREIYADPAAREEFVRQVRTEGRVLNFRARMRRKDGSFIEVLENARAVFDDDGELLYYQGAVYPAPPPA
jgi:PAS domain S-box-containing protein